MKLLILFTNFINSIFIHFLHLFRLACGSGSGSGSAWSSESCLARDRGWVGSHHRYHSLLYQFSNFFTLLWFNHFQGILFEIFKLFYSPLIYQQF